MKILQINCVYDYGSTGKITRDIHKNLQKNGFDSVVLYGRRQKVQEAGVYKTCTEFEAKAWNVLSRLTGRPYAVTPFGTLSRGQGAGSLRAESAGGCRADLPLFWCVWWMRLPDDVV